MAQFVPARRIREQYDVSAQTLRNWALRSVGLTPIGAVTEGY